MSASAPNLLEIDRKLREDFRRRAKDFGFAADTTDPLLAVLFRSVAQQIDQVYSDTGRLRHSLLLEMMHGLDMQQFLAKPAQAAVRLVNTQPEPRLLRAGTELSAVGAGGERMTFSLDASIEISQARIALALSYQDQALRLIPGVPMSETVEALRPSLEPVPLALGPHSAIFLAFENLPASLVSRHGLFFDLGPGSYPVQHALCHEPWWLFGEDGELSSDGLLRPHSGNAGVYHLQFQTGEDTPTTDGSLPGVPDGFYTGRQFVLPAMGPGSAHPQPFHCHCPRLLEPALSRILGRDFGALAQTSRVWIRISMPRGTPALHHAIGGAMLHAMTASNVFARNRTVDFHRDGTSVPVVRQTETPEHLVAPITVMSVENEPYAAGNQPQADPTAGRFELQNNRLTLYPGLHHDGTPQEAANVRLWLTNGDLGNSVGPGGITSFSNPAALSGVQIAPLTSAAGGSDGEHAASAERRFADALTTRGRIVTRHDLTTAALAIDRRIVHATTSSGMERRDGGLRRVERLELLLDPDGFSKVDVELPALRAQVDSALRPRLVHGLELEVDFVWK